MNAEVKTYSRYIQKQIASIRDLLRGLTEEQINWQPPLPGSNSLYVIASHVLGNVRAWVLGIACGQPMTRDRPAEFAASGSFADIDAAARKVSAEIEAALAAMDSARLDRRVVPSQELWGEGEPREISVREALVHVLEHASAHLGHMQMTRDIVLRHVQV